MVRKHFLFMLSFCAALAISCSEDSDDGGGDGGTTPMKTVVQSFDIMLNNANSIPMVTDRNETGNIEMSLYNDNTLEFTINISDLASSDALTVAHVHTGDVVSTGDVAIVLVDGENITFSGSTATGTIELNASQISTLQGSNVYVNVHSTQSSSGLVRGQIDQTIANAYNVALSPDNEVPMVTGRNETGMVYIRLVGSTMYYKAIVNDLDETDAIMAGHIHEGNSTSNGGVLINLELTGNDQLDITKEKTLSADELTKINNDALYVNIHSNQVASGLLRGQIR